ncbi:hypothetical protein BGZ98_007761 [Dissophora globulifera]|nr:hypothetical protein BGZ98_007761 [Dissophora globulifera]
MGNQHSKRPTSKGHRASDPNVHPLNNNDLKEAKAKNRISHGRHSPHVEQQQRQQQQQQPQQYSGRESKSPLQPIDPAAGDDPHQQQQSRTSRESNRFTWTNTNNSPSPTASSSKTGVATAPAPSTTTATIIPSSGASPSAAAKRSSTGSVVGKRTLPTSAVAIAAATTNESPLRSTTPVVATIHGHEGLTGRGAEQQQQPQQQQHRTVPPVSPAIDDSADRASNSQVSPGLCAQATGVGAGAKESSGAGSQTLHSSDTIAKTSNRSTSENDTQPRQSSPSRQEQEQQQQQQEFQSSPPVPSVPFAVTKPGNPILIKKHNLTPLAISGSYSSSLLSRSPTSPKFGSHKKSAELSPSARLSFLGPSSPSDKGLSKSNNGTSTGVDVDDMISRLLDAGYSGRISKSICLKNSEILFICQTAREIFLSQPTLIELNAPVKIVGDIHGQYTDLLRLFEMCGFPPSANFLFLGDYVDRGKMSLETILLLFCYKIKYPENFFLLRGNHECANVTRVYGFYDECKRRANIKMWKAFVDVFNCLPLAAIVANKIFCVHGGLSPNLTTMDDIRALRRPTDVPDYGLLNDLLWSDPSDTALDWEDNERGVSYCFGRSIIQRFLNRHDFDLVCRAHMVVEDGYEFFNDRTLVTVFSAPNYCGEFDNYGAVMSVNEDLLCSFELLKPIDPVTARAQMQSLAASAGGWRVNKQRLSLPDSNTLFGNVP